MLNLLFALCTKRMVVQTVLYSIWRWTFINGITTGRPVNIVRSKKGVKLLYEEEILKVPVDTGIKKHVLLEC